MRFIRRHYAKNIVNDEHAKPVFPPEIFENVKHFKIAMEGYVKEIDDGYDIGEIIESDNYFTIISKDRKHVECIRFDNTIGFEFEQY